MLHTLASLQLSPQTLPLTYESFEKLQEQVLSLRLKLAESQAACTSLKEEHADVMSVRQQMLLEKSRLETALLAKDLELESLKKALSSSQANLQQAAAGASEVATLKRKVTTADHAYSELKQQQASEQAAAMAKVSELEQVTASLSAKETELLCATASLSKAQAELMASQSRVSELERDLERQHAQVCDQHHALKKLHTELLKSAELATGCELDNSTLQEALKVAAGQNESSQHQTATAHQMSLAQVSLLESEVKQFTERHSHLQQQLRVREEAYVHLEQQHANVQARVSSIETDSAAMTHAMNSKLSQLQESLVVKDANVNQLRLELQASKKQVDALHAETEELQNQQNPTVTQSKSTTPNSANPVSSGGKADTRTTSRSRSDRIVAAKIALPPQRASAHKLAMQSDIGGSPNSPHLTTSASATSIAMPEGSVDNPLADCHEQHSQSPQHTESTQTMHHMGLLESMDAAKRAHQAQAHTSRGLSCDHSALVVAKSASNALVATLPASAGSQRTHLAAAVQMPTDAQQVCYLGSGRERFNRKFERSLSAL